MQHDYEMHNLRTKLAAVALGTGLALGAGVALGPAADAQTDQTQQREERLQAKVDEGLITQERADAIRERVAQRAERREARQADRAEFAGELAETLGITVDELTSQLRAGLSLADVAEAAGISTDVLIDQIEAHRTERIAAAVADGLIDQERADEKLETLRDDITDRVNGERPERAEGRRGFRHRGGN